MSASVLDTPDCLSGQKTPAKATAADSPVDRWRNRRAMAWLALLAALSFPLLSLSVDGATLSALAGPFYLFAGAVVGAYIGFATLDDRWQKPEESHA